MRGKKAKGSYSRQIDDTLELTAITSATAAADPQADDNLKVDVFSPTRVGPAPRGRCVSACCCCCIGRRCRQTRRLVCLVLVLMTFEVAYELTELLGSCSNRPQLVHIPKTGGTAMMYVGLMNNIFWGGFAWRGLCQKEWKDAPWAQEDLPPRFYGGANATFIATASTTFCAVRDPLSRLLSAYRYVLPLHSPALRGGTDAEGGTARAILSPGAEILLPSCNASKMADIRNGEWWLTDAWCDPGVASGLLLSAPCREHASAAQLHSAVLDDAGVPRCGGWLRGLAWWPLAHADAFDSAALLSLRYARCTDMLTRSADGEPHRWVQQPDGRAWTGRAPPSGQRTSGPPPCLRHLQDHDEQTHRGSRPIGNEAGRA
jgi:hypothetical protein